MTPTRIQRKRTKGWRMPEGAVYVGRPTKWGNPFVIDGSWITWAAVGLGYRGDAGGRRAAAVALHAAWLRGESVEAIPDDGTTGGVVEFDDGSTRTIADHARVIALGATSLFPSPVLPTRPDPAELRGKDLVCWCPLDQPCHADVLLEIANSS